MHSYTRPVNFDKLILFQNEVYFVPFSTTPLQVNLTTCKRFFSWLFYPIALCFIRMRAVYNFSYQSTKWKMCTKIINNRGITQPKADLPAENRSICTKKIWLRGGSRGRVQGVRTPPPWDDLRFSNTTGILFIGVEVEQVTSAPPPKKNPRSAPVTWHCLFD